jgi:hypothetical protein
MFSSVDQVVYMAKKAGWNTVILLSSL